MDSLVSTDTGGSLLFTVLPVILGGVGLFLVGMILMSDGLKAAAGESLRRVLERSTGTRWSAFLSGAGLTALVQSSSATTVTTIGFVSAGLLSFPAAIGVMIGSNVGTTSTGWIVSLLGLKLNVGSVALPLIGVGALLRLIATGRRASVGLALAGFGLIFVGIDTLQGGMGGLTDRIDFSTLSDGSLAGRLALVLAGAVMTVLLQSSSAAVALSLTALHSGAIDVPQAAHLVIGQNLGTTVTALLASVGASVPARRTALAHVVFNAVTGGLALIAVGPLLSLVDRIGRVFPPSDAAVSIALFHTIFNLLGAGIFLPFTGPFARSILRLLPDRGPTLTRHLDASLLQLPSVAIEAGARALGETTAAILDEAGELLRGAVRTRQADDRLEAARSAIRETRTFLTRVLLDQHQWSEYNRRLKLLHASDHLHRLVDACLQHEAPLRPLGAATSSRHLAAEVAAAAGWLRQPGWAGADLVERLAEFSTRQAEERRSHRARLLEQTAAGHLSPDETQAQLDMMRWVDRIGFHTWRAMHHLAGPGPATDSEVYDERESEPSEDSPES